MPRIRDVQRLADASRQVAALPAALRAALAQVLSDYRHRDLCEGDHVELLLVDERAVRLNLFVDVDGTLWLERLAASCPRSEVE